MARLGAGALFVSAIGNDDLGDDFVALLQSERAVYQVLVLLCSQGAALWRRCIVRCRLTSQLSPAHFPCLLAICCAAERGVDTSAIQRVERPTRDILVTRKPDGDRQFAGFGKASELC